MSLLERGLIPANAKITFDPLPIAPKKMSIDGYRPINKRIDESKGNGMIYNKTY